MHVTPFGGLSLLAAWCWLAIRPPLAVLGAGGSPAVSTPAHLESLWAPWRVEYFALERPLPDFFTEAAQTSDDASHLVVLRRKSGFLLMNRFPYAGGHLMAVPYRKTADLGELTANEKLELFTLAEDAQVLLRDVVHAQGFNVGLNLGACAGAGVTDHLHLHIVPRWPGDYNFMAVVGATRGHPGRSPAAVREARGGTRPSGTARRHTAACLARTRLTPASSDLR